MELQLVTEAIIGAAMRVHSELGPGFLESVYHNALLHELQKRGLQAKSQIPIKVLYDGLVVGDYVADLIVSDLVIIELKAVERLLPVHEVQLVNYLTATKHNVGLLINFGNESLQFKRKHRSRRALAEARKLNLAALPSSTPVNPV